MKILAKILIGLAILVVILVIGKNFFIKMAVKAGAKYAVGLQLDMKKLNAKILDGRIAIEGLQLENPAGFSDPVMVNMPYLTVDLDMGKAFNNNIYFEDFKLHLKEVFIIINEDGEKNIDKLTAVKEAKEEDKKPKKQKEKKEDSGIGINNLHLKIEKVIFKDYSRGGEPVVKEFNINLDEKHENIQSVRALSGLILVKIMTKTALGSLLNIQLDDFINMLEDSLGIATGAISGAGQELEDAAQGLKNATKNITDQIKLPFGGNKEK